MTAQVHTSSLPTEGALAQGLAPTLAWLAQRTGCPCSGEHARAVAQRSLFESSPSGTTAADPAWVALLVQAAQAIQLRMRPHRLAVTQMLRDLQPHMAVVTVVDDVPGEESWLAIARLRPGRFALFSHSSRRVRHRQVSARVLQNILKSYGLLESRTWLYAEPLFALGALTKTAVAAADGRAVKRVTPWQRLRAWLRMERAVLWIVFTHALIIGLLTLLTPAAAQALVNTVAFGSLLQPLVVLSALLAVGLGFRAAVMTLKTWTIELLQRRIFVRVAEDLAERLVRVDHAAHRERDVPAYVQRFFDVMNLQKSAATLLMDGLALALQLLVGTALLAFYHPLLLAFDMVLIILLLTVIVPNARLALQSALAESSAKYQTAAWLQCLSLHPQVFSAYTGQSYATSRARLLCRDYLDARSHHFGRMLRLIVGGFGLQIFAMVALLGVGGYLVIERQLTLGQLVAAELVISMTGVGFSKLGKHLERLYDLLAGLDKIGSLVDLPLETAGHGQLASVSPAKVELHQVAASLASSQRRFYIDALRLDPGDKVALTGSQGSGKSLLLNLIWGLEHNYSGALYVDDVEGRQADLAQWREELALVRAPELWSGTVLDHLTLGDPHIHKEALWDALDRVGLAETVRDLPQGLSTPLRAGAEPLSSTAVRLLALARALIQQPRLLLVDGALDYLHLDVDTKARVLDAFLAPDAPWTALVVSADPEVLRRLPRQLQLGAGGGVQEP
ncbi:MAG: ATP-binding cassette domain-containing protein [Polyangiales bacterium]